MEELKVNNGTTVICGRAQLPGLGAVIYESTGKSVHNNSKSNINSSRKTYETPPLAAHYMC